jgi:putative ABC transport system permease protein
MKDNLLLSNILHRPVRSLVSILGIGLGVLLIIATVGLANGTLRSNARREANVGAEIMVRASGTFGMSGSEPFRLPVAMADQIAKLDGVQSVVPIGQNLDSASDSETGSRLIDGIDFDAMSRLAGLQIVEGRPLGADGDEAIVDTAWQAQKDIKVGSKLKIYDKDFTVVGTFEPPSGARIKIPLKRMQHQLSPDADNCTMLLVKVKNPDQQDAVAKSIASQFPNNQVIFTRDFEELYVHAIPAIDVFLNVVIGVAAVIGTLVILLTMYTTVTERTRQIGILKSLGMSKFDIASLITKEALLISLFGVIAGVAMALPLPFVLAKTSSSMQVSFELKWVILTLAGGLAGGAIGALYPAIRAARMEAVDALSHE